MRITLEKIIILVLCCILLATALPYNLTNTTEKIYASDDTFTVTPKEHATFFVNQIIRTNQFDFSLNGSNINENNITISPSIFTSAGTKEITVSYDTETTFYQQKLNIEVKNVVADHLELSFNNITLVKNQDISTATLPDVYLYYNDGTKKIVTDYTTEIDWDEEILKISSNGLTITQKITVVDSQISYIQISAKKSVVPVDYEFVNDDFVVTAYFTDGTSMIVTDYQIEPYTLVAGKETIITIKYLTVASSVIVRSTTSFQITTVTGSAVATGAVVTITPTPSTTATVSTDITYTVSNKETPKIILKKTTVTQGIGEKVKVNVKTKPNATISMYSKNKRIAIITKNGYVKGIKKGKTKIVITAGASKATIGVNVYPAPSKIGVTSNLSSSTKHVLKKGATYQIPIYFNKGAYSNKVTFHSSNKKVASVTKKGKISAKKAGKAVIHISSFNHKKASVRITVIK